MKKNRINHFLSYSAGLLFGTSVILTSCSDNKSQSESATTENAPSSNESAHNVLTEQE